MAVETVRWDGSEYLDNPESMIAQIADSLAEGDPALMALVLGDVARAIGMTLISRETGIDRAILYKAIVSDGSMDKSALADALDRLKSRLQANPAPFSEAAE